LDVKSELADRETYDSEEQRIRDWHEQVEEKEEAAPAAPAWRAAAEADGKKGRGKNP
jgi:hypothetical protein